MNTGTQFTLPFNRHAMVLACFAFLVAVVLAATQAATKDRIALNEKQQQAKVFAELLPSQLHDHSLDRFKLQLKDAKTNRMRTCYIAKVDGVATAAIISATATDGYSGDIDLLIGVLKDGTISGVRVSKHSETPGLGDAIELHRSNWVLSFDGKSLSDPTKSGWALKKYKGEFDQFTGATITPRAVVNEVNNTLQFFNSVKSQLFSL